jgi:hypothetical protein
LIAWITPRKPTRIIFEAMGAYHRGLQNALAKASLPGVKVNPWQACRFAEATGKRAKTDAVDAAMLARFGATLQLEIRPAPHPAISHLAELLTARRALVKDRTAALNRGKTLTLPLLKRQRDTRRNASFAPVKRVVCCDNEGISCRRTVHAFHQYDNIRIGSLPDMSAMLSQPGIASCVVGADIEYRGQNFQECFDKFRVDMRTCPRVDMRHNFVERPRAPYTAGGTAGRRRHRRWRRCGYF